VSLEVVPRIYTAKVTLAVTASNLIPKCRFIRLCLRPSWFQRNVSDCDR